MKTALVEFKEKNTLSGYEGKIFVDGRHIANVEGRTTNSVKINYKKWCKRNSFTPENI